MSEFGSASTGAATSHGLASLLEAWFASDRHYAIALSGGVDSAVVAKAASNSSANAVVVTARSESVSAAELADVQLLLGQLALPHRFLETDEVRDPRYQANDHRRCYFCKTFLFESVRKRYPDSVIVTGTNVDDLSDYRPGLVAAKENDVRAPLAELGIGKSQVRQLAAGWELSVADKPASPCLASRIAYGVSVTAERLAMVEQAEALLREMGLREFRVRLHSDDIARIEVAPEVMSRFMQAETRERLVSQFAEIGFRFVALDLAGFKSGSLNPVYQIAESPAISH